MGRSVKRLLLVVVALVAGLCIASSQTILAADKDAQLPPGIEKKSEAPGKGQHKGWVKDKKKEGTKKEKKAKTEKGKKKKEAKEEKSGTKE